MRPISYAFDPAGISLSGAAKKELFSFLKDSISVNVPGLENSVSFDPRIVGVPWPTSFPATVQCKHWREAEEAALELMQEIEEASLEERGLLPTDLYSAASIHSSRKKREELLETAVTAPMNMFPASCSKRARLMAKANLLIFMHDALSDSVGGKQGMEPWRNRIFRKYVKEVLSEEPTIGPEFLKGILKWVEHTRTHPPKISYNTLSDYIEYRIKDFAVDFVDAALKLTCNVNISASEIEPLAHLHRLYITHFSLTNDLYSYDKELREMEERGSALVNGIKVLQDLLSVSPRAAKNILRAFLWDIEDQIHDAYKGLIDTGELNDKQLRFARGMIETLAGNIFYSSTTRRYASVVAGSAIVN
ncbi:isoprenoid synthase domain-containing protein [Bisporella sp. PMI_857]|nr:isoprenoid synthase domain-containing protein [Bisporella sp. PMI_857]